MDLFRKVCLFSFAGILILTLAACDDGNEDRSVGTDMVDLPFSADGDKKKKMPEITFDTSEVSTGRILQGEVRNFTFNFKNTGKGPLVISNVSASCGCTVPLNYPRGKILPGEGGSIEVEYDSQSKWGKQVSVISLATNAIPNRTELILRADVVAPDKPE
ncbi:MAG: DUF1573 domain-containing protein [Cryomorphaceae bacterium]|nr:DUF1573 domain-containing protein [Flavobacteriales bacterium]